MSGCDDAEKLRARQDREIRKRAKLEAEERRQARLAAKAEAKRAEELRLLAEVKAAKSAGAMPATGKARPAAKAKAGNRPILGSRTVPDPLEPGAKLIATVNLAEHPLEMMLARRRLEQAHYEAGVRYRAIYERAMIGPGRGIDPSRIKVDGGKLGDPLSDEVAHAHMELGRLARELGPVGERIVAEVCGAGETVSALAQRWPGPDAARAKLDYLTLRFREALDYLATHVWGATGPARGKLAGARGLGSGHVDMQAVEVANQSYLRKRGIAL